MTKRAWICLGVSAVFSVGSLAVIGVAMFWPIINPLSWDFALVAASYIFLISSVYLVAMCSRHWLEIKPMIVYVVAYIWLVTSFLALAASVVFIGSNIFPDWVHNVLVVAAITSVFFSLLNFRKWLPDRKGEAHMGKKGYGIASALALGVTLVLYLSAHLSRLFFPALEGTLASF